MQNEKPKSVIFSPFVHFAEGALAPFKAMKLVALHPRLWAACLLPWAVAGTVGWFLIHQAMALGGSFLAWMALTTGFSVTGWLATALEWLVAGTSWILGALFTLWLSALLAIPFSDWLSELAEAYTDPPLPRAAALQGWWSRAHWRRLKLDFWKSLASLTLSGAGLLVSAIPLLGLAGPVLLAMGMALQFLAYPQTRRDEGLMRSIGFLAANPARSLGFGLVLLAGFSIPFLSAFLLPFAVVGGTIVYARAQDRARRQDTPNE